MKALIYSAAISLSITLSSCSNGVDLTDSLFNNLFDNIIGSGSSDLDDYPDFRSENKIRAARQNELLKDIGAYD
ncbi:hypothetical protein OAB00_00290 [Akkermansiaceae bacterium]|nr:hypothetical protein [Akkermansiaceae bacterium]